MGFALKKQRQAEIKHDLGGTQLRIANLDTEIRPLGVHIQEISELARTSSEEAKSYKRSLKFSVLLIASFFISVGIFSYFQVPVRPQHATSLKVKVGPLTESPAENVKENIALQEVPKLAPVSQAPVYSLAQSPKLSNKNSYISIVDQDISPAKNIIVEPPQGSTHKHDGLSWDGGFGLRSKSGQGLDNQGAQLQQQTSNPFGTQESKISSLPSVNDQQVPLLRYLDR